jgi:hypothetical protein
LPVEDQPGRHGATIAITRATCPVKAVKAWLHAAGITEGSVQCGAKCGFGRPIDLARAEPVAVAKRRRPAVAVRAVDGYKRSTALELTKALAFAHEYNHWQASR